MCVLAGWGCVDPKSHFMAGLFSAARWGNHRVWHVKSSTVRNYARSPMRRSEPARPRRRPSSLRKSMPPARKKPTKRKSRAKSAKEVRLKAFWGVFNQSMKRVALFEYSQRKQADKKAAELVDFGQIAAFRAARQGSHRGIVHARRFSRSLVDLSIARRFALCCPLHPRPRDRDCLTAACRRSKIAEERPRPACGRRVGTALEARRARLHSRQATPQRDSSPRRMETD